MLLYIDIKNGEKDVMELIFNAIAIKDNIGYASDYERNGLFEVDINTGACKYIRLFPNEEVMSSYLHSCCVWIENKVYFIPAAGKNISIYNVDTREIVTIEIPYELDGLNADYSKRLKFSKAFEREDYLWIMPATYPGIIKLNIKTEKIVIINNWLPNDGFMFRRAVCAKGNVIYAASGNNNNILIFDLDTEIGRIKKIGALNNGVMDMCENGEDLVMAPRLKGAVIKWNLVTNEIKEYCDYPKCFIPGKIVFSHIYPNEQEYILVPANASHGIRLQDGKLIVDDIIQWKTDIMAKVELMFELNNQLYLREISNNLSNRFYVVNKNDNEVFDFCFVIINEEERKKAFIQATTNNQEVMRETSTFRFTDWLDLMN